MIAKENPTLILLEEGWGRDRRFQSWTGPKTLNPIRLLSRSKRDFVTGAGFAAIAFFAHCPLYSSADSRPALRGLFELVVGTYAYLVELFTR